MIIIITRAADKSNCYRNTYPLHIIIHGSDVDLGQIFVNNFLNNRQRLEEVE